MPIYNRLPHRQLPKLLTLCRGNIWGMACWRCRYNQHQNRNDSHYSHHGTRTQENDGRILHFPFEYMARSAKIKTKDSQDTRWRWMKEARQNFMTIVYLYKDHAKWVIAYIEQCFTVYCQNETRLNDAFQVLKQWSHMHWSFFVSRKLSVRVLTTINIPLCIKELERKLQSITENIYLGYVVLRGHLRCLNQWAPVSCVLLGNGNL